MKTRIIAGLVALPVLIFILLANPEIFTVAVAIISLIGLLEFYKCTGVANSKLLVAAGIIATVFMFVREYFWLTLYGAELPLFVIILFLLVLTGHKKINITHAALALFGVFYVAGLFLYAVKIKMYYLGGLYIWLVVLGAFMTDTFAYFTGVFLGKHKLCPEISPKKTVEGAIGGIVGCGLSFIVYGIILEKCFNLDVNYVNIFILGMIASVVSMIGDLSASIIKRHFGIKDYGNLIPGHGGILDRCDSLIMVAPVVYYFIILIGIIK